MFQAAEDRPDEHTQIKDLWKLIILKLTRPLIYWLKISFMSLLPLDSLGLVVKVDVLQFLNCVQIPHTRFSQY